MKIVILDKFQTSAGSYFLTREETSPETTSEMAQNEMFLFPEEVFNEFSTKIGEFLYLIKNDAVMRLYELPKVAKSTPGIRVGRLIKFVLHHFYRQLEERYMSFDEFALNPDIKAALEIYEQISKRSPLAWLVRNQYALVSTHKDALRVNGSTYTYKQIRRYYPNQEVVMCQWKLGEDDCDSVLVYNNRTQGRADGKMIVDPVMTMDLHKHFVQERVLPLQAFLEQQENYLGAAVKTFYTLRHLEADHREMLVDLRNRTEQLKK